MPVQSVELGFKYLDDMPEQELKILFTRGLHWI